MKRKLYGRYNNRSKQIEFIFLAENDDMAQYQFGLSHLAAIEKNPYHNPNDYSLCVLGVMNMEGEKNEVGILIDKDTKNDFPYFFDSVKDGQMPKYNTEYFTDISVKNKELKELLEKARL